MNAIAIGTQFGFSYVVNEIDMPHLLGWIAQIDARPACKRMFAEVPHEFRRKEEADVN